MRTIYPSGLDNWFHLNSQVINYDKSLKKADVPNSQNNLDEDISSKTLVYITTKKNGFKWEETVFSWLFLKRKNFLLVY